jgi:hypothetical protein
MTTIFEKIKLDAGEISLHEFREYADTTRDKVTISFFKEYKQEFLTKEDIYYTDISTNLANAARSLQHMFYKDQGSTVYNQQLDCFRGYSLKYLWFLQEYAEKVKEAGYDA